MSSFVYIVLVHVACSKYAARTIGLLRLRYFLHKENQWSCQRVLHQTPIWRRNGGQIYSLSNILRPVTVPCCLYKMPFSLSRVYRLLPKSLFACSETFFDKSKACSRQCRTKCLCSSRQAQPLRYTRPSGSNSWHCCSSSSPSFMNKKRCNELLKGILVWATAR